MANLKMDKKMKYLHDLIAMGELLKALTISSTLTDEELDLQNRMGTNRQSPVGTTLLENDLSIDPVVVASPSVRLRLPLLLRYLSSLQQSPYTISSTIPTKFKKTAEKDEGELEEELHTRQIQATVGSLECVAATHPSAEEMEVLVSFLVPKISKRLFNFSASSSTIDTPLSSNLPASLPSSAKKNAQSGTKQNLLLRRITPSHPFNTPDEAVWRGAWDKRPLRKALTALYGTASKDLESTNQELDPEEDLLEVDIDITDHYGDEQEDVVHITGNKKKKRSLSPLTSKVGNTRRRTINSRSSRSMLQDSQESNAVKAMSELITLLLASLDTYMSPRFQMESFRDQIMNFRDECSTRDKIKLLRHISSVIIPVKPDSLWMEYSSNVGGSASSGATDLAAVLTAFMHNCPVFRHVHVANAVCRTGITRVQYINVRMAANCPAASHSIIRGCVDAYLQANKAINLASALLQGLKDASAIWGKPSTSTLSTIRNSDKTKSPDREDGGVEDNSDGHQKELEDIISQCRGICVASYLSIIQIAELSHREASTAIRAVEQVYNSTNGIMLDILLELYMTHDSHSAVRLILKELRKPIDKNSAEINSVTCFKNSSESQNMDEAKDPSPAIETKKRTRRVRKAPDRALFNPVKVIAYTLKDLLKENEELCSLVRSFFLNVFARLKLDKSKPTCLENTYLGADYFFSCSLQALANIILHTGIRLEPTSHETTFVTELLVSTRSILDLTRFLNKRETDRNAGVFCDSLLTNYAAAFIVLCTKSLAIGHTINSVHGMEESNLKFIQEVFTELLFLGPMLQREFGSFIAGIARCILSRNGLGFKHIVLDTLRFVGEGSSALDDAFMNTCLWMHNILAHDFLKQTTTKILNNATAKSLIRMAARGHWEGLDSDFLTHRLMEDTELAYHMNSDRQTLPFLKAVAKNASQTRVPHVLPLKIERSVRSMNWLQEVSALSDEHRKKIILTLFQVYYAIVFSAESGALFSVDFATLPLKHMVDFCARSSESLGINVSIIGKIMGITICKYCPEKIFLQTEFPNFAEHGSGVTLELVSEAIRCCHHRISSGKRAERIFFLGYQSLESSDVDVAAASALLVQTGDPQPFYTYSTLVRDPLLLLKCPIRVWKNNNLRIILLHVLQRLLVANNSFALRQFSSKRRVANEYIFSRNLLVLRSLAMAECDDSSDTESSKSTKNRPFCRMSTNLVRFLIVSNNGILVSLSRQGIPDSAAEWIVKIAPECVMEKSSFIQALSNAHSLTATERMSLSDIAIQIIFLYEFDDDHETLQLLYHVLSILISSFYLILGPIGLPVNVLCEDEGEDVTQKIRRKAFRVLNTLKHLPGKSESMKKETVMAISKFAATCKSEGGPNVAGGSAAAKRRKAILSDLWEASNRILKLMGGAQPDLR